LKPPLFLEVILGWSVSLIFASKYLKKIVGSSSSFMNWLFLFQLPIYLVVALGCYGLFMVGFGLMFFPTCPREAVLLQQVSYFNVRLNCRTLETS
jgi:predicted permease